MKVVHIVKADAKGAYTAAMRLNSALNENGVESEILTKEDVKKVLLQYPWIALAKFIEKRHVSKVIKNDYYYSDDTYGMYPKLMTTINTTDIVHFHWVSKGLIGRNTLKCLSKWKKPIVWTLHDMRPFTGGCHYTNGCEKFYQGCDSCPIFGRSSTAFDDVRRNTTLYRLCKIKVVGCSHWISSCAKNSTAMKELEITTIHNCIDLNKFRQESLASARAFFGLASPYSKKIILFGAMSSTSDLRKGFSYLVKALKKLSRDEYVCAIFGGDVDEQQFPLDVIKLGAIISENVLIKAYSIADVFVAPSTQENLANTVVEASACGVPTVAFNIGGMPDMINHRVTGYLAKPFDADDLAAGIMYCANNDAMRAKVRYLAEQKFNNKDVAEKYISIYKSLLQQ